MAYRYTLSIGGTSSSYISFDVPDNFMAGETITVQGEIHNADFYRVNTISFEAWPQNYTFSGFMKSGCISSGDITVSVAKGKTSPFSLTLSVQDISGKLSSTSSYANPLKFGFYLEYTATKGNMAIVGCSEVPNERLAYLLYRCNPRILEMDFERCGPSGAWQDDGQYFRCKALRISKTAQASASIFSKKTILCTGTDGSSRSFSLTSSQLSAAFSSSGYSETGYSSSNVFYGFTSALGVTYTLTLTVGDAYDQDSFADKVNRAFARMHLSGASDGGVAIGMFSSSTNGHPKFEVAENHESHFYGPVYFEGGVSGIATDYTLGEVATGGHWIDGKPIYRFIATFTSMDTKPTVPSKVDTIISLRGMATNKTNGNQCPVPYTHNGSFNPQVMLTYIKDNNTISMSSSGTNYSTGPFFIIAEYTKA